MLATRGLPCSNQNSARSLGILADVHIIAATIVKLIAVAIARASSGSAKQGRDPPSTNSREKTRQHTANYPVTSTAKCYSAFA